ncbi:DNA-directed RNA polymerase subunit E'' [Candidatus Micrarchaeota archaeon]|nr:DNA-directed RNA polymerase subunit E'' [Candidatus Micrarchaeota archaeon]MBU1166194.1 DNA-directed RNA polymerase subunit E'' [Candidatus Micrarchaeota archaeon]MBU1887125.1 DNA-directed RNA polymerase subunit E'' [Candidatus Micrarchaeota archaeon]
MRACKQCNYIVVTKDKLCPKCQGELTDKYSGTIIILEPEKSEIAKVVGVNVVGSYAIRVK